MSDTESEASGDGRDDVGPLPAAAPAAAAPAPSVPLAPSITNPAAGSKLRLKPKEKPKLAKRVVTQVAPAIENMAKEIENWYPPRWFRRNGFRGYDGP